MANSLIIGDDNNVAAWAYATFKVYPMQFDRVYGILNEDRTLVGAIILNNFNGNNIELSYYGYKTLSAGIVRSLCRLGVAEFNPSRCTVLVPKRNKRLMRSLDRFGWKLEGVQRRFYGKQDNNRNTCVRFVLFRDQIDKIAGLTSNHPKQGQG